MNGSRVDSAEAMGLAAGEAFPVPVPPAAAARGADRDGDSAIASLLRLLWEPGRTFERLVQRPTWWLPFALGALLAMGFGWVMARKVDFDRSLRQQMAAREEKMGVKVPQEEIEKIAASQERMAVFYPFFGALGFLFYFFLIAGVLKAAAGACGSEATPSQVLSVVSYAQAPNLLASAFAVIVVASAPDRSLTMDQVRHPLVADLAAWLPATGSAVTTALASSLDLFPMLTVALLMIGFGRLPDLTRRNGALIPLFLWIGYIALKVAWTAVFA